MSKRFKPSSKIVYWPFQGGTSSVDLSCFFLSCVCYAFVRVCLYVPCGHLLGSGLTSWLSFVVSNCEFVTFPLVSWVRCGTWLYRFLIFAPLLTLLRRLAMLSHGWAGRIEFYFQEEERRMVDHFDFFIHIFSFDLIHGSSQRQTWRYN